MGVKQLDILIESGDIVLRALMSVVVLFILTKLLGAKQISQLSFFDYAIGISIGSIAAEMTINRDLPYHYAAVAMVVYTLLALLISYTTNKSIWMRRFFVGTPKLLINNGRLIEKNLKRTKLDVNELLSECRIAGYFNISDVKFAIMETNGEISFMPKDEKRGVVCEDMQIQPSPEGMVANVVIDGKVMERNLKAAGKNGDWLHKKLKEQKCDKIQDILLATVDNNSQLSVYFKNDDSPGTTMFD